MTHMDAMIIDGKQGIQDIQHSPHIICKTSVMRTAEDLRDVFDSTDRSDSVPAVSCAIGDCLLFIEEEDTELNNHSILPRICFT